MTEPHLVDWWWVEVDPQGAEHKPRVRWERRRLKIRDHCLDGDHLLLLVHLDVVGGERKTQSVTGDGYVLTAKRGKGEE